MSKRKIKFISIIIFVLLLFGIALGLIGYYSNGFKNWDYFKFSQPPVSQLPPEQPPIEQPPVVELNKQIVATILETKSYGTFTLPKNYLRTSYGYVFKNKTKLDYLLNEWFIKEGFTDEEIAEYSKQCKVAVYFDNDVQNYFNVNYVANSKNDYGYDLYTFENNEFFYTYSGDVSQVKESIHLGIMLDNGIEKAFTELQINVYVEDYVFGENSFLRVINSDSGVPLTKGLYDKILADTATKITNVYEEVKNEQIKD